MEEKIFFQSENHCLEGLISKNTEEKGVVIAHPHPLYGGNMYNPVVEAIARCYQKSGYATLRFNFRGVGKSEGSFDEGIGEQRDVMAAISAFREKGIKQIDLAGYSFGSYVIAHIGYKTASVENMVMVSPPAAFMDFRGLGAIPCLRLVVTGARDQIAPAELVKKMLPAWNPDAGFEIIEGADHFYSGCLKKLEAVLFSE
jgi:alpha/beta superfamily hydrolase